MGEELSKSQQILMWELFAAGGEKLNTDIVPKPDKKDREALIKKGLVETQPRGRTFLIKLKDDRGWRWISDSDPFPIAEGEKRVTAERRLLQSLVRGFKRYARQQGSTIQQLFRATDEAAGRSEPSKQTDKFDDQTETDSSIGESEPPIVPIETAIRSAFFDIAGKPARNQVRLRQLRERLASIDRGDLDAAIKNMRETGRARLSTLSNPPDIAEEGDAALKIKNVFYHTIWIEP